MKTPALRIAVPALTLAVLAGITETVVAVIGFLATDGLPPGWQLQIGLRVLIYGGLLVLIALTWRGSRVARWAVVVLLGVFGLGSLLVPLITALAGGAGLLDALAGSGPPVFAVIRAAHIVLAVVGIGALLVHRAPRSAAPVAA